MASFQDQDLASLREDPLSPQARAQHRNVLLMSSIAILVSILDLVPTRISALGVDLESSDRTALRVALLLAVVYFAVAFAVVAIGDFAAWRVAYSDSRDSRQQTRLNAERFRRKIEGMREPSVVDEAALADRDDTIAQFLDAQERHALYRILVPLGFARMIIDFVVPLSIALVAVVALALTL